MTKTKMSTVAIVVLSVLLAAALAATIVLAAFAFTGSAATTIKFANGITVTATGIDNGVWQAYAVGTDGKKGDSVTTGSEITSGVAFSAIKLKNTSTTQAIKVAVAVVITSTAGTADTGSVAPKLYVSATDGSTSAFTTATELKQSTATGANFGSSSIENTKTSTGAESVTHWLVYSIAANAEIAVSNWINTAFIAADIANYTGAKIEAKFYVAAGYDDAGLDQAITSGDFSKAIAKTA